MTTEEKNLLLKDLCARLTYGVKVCYRLSDKDKPITETLSGHMLDYFNENSIIEVKPYLRPMSSMTIKELNECVVLSGLSELQKVDYTTNEEQKRLEHSINVFLCDAKQIDWLNAHHFDYRGLIPMGLAQEAPEGMYNN